MQRGFCRTSISTIFLDFAATSVSSNKFNSNVKSSCYKVAKMAVSLLATSSMGCSSLSFGPRSPSLAINNTNIIKTTKSQHDRFKPSQHHALSIAIKHRHVPKAFRYIRSSSPLLKTTVPSPRPLPPFLPLPYLIFRRGGQARSSRLPGSVEHMAFYSSLLAIPTILSIMGIVTYHNLEKAYFNSQINAQYYKTNRDMLKAHAAKLIQDQETKFAKAGYKWDGMIYNANGEVNKGAKVPMSGERRWGCRERRRRRLPRQHRRRHLRQGMAQLRARVREVSTSGGSGGSTSAGEGTIASTAAGTSVGTDTSAGAGGSAAGGTSDGTTAGPAGGADASSGAGGSSGVATSSDTNTSANTSTGAGEGSLGDGSAGTSADGSAGDQGRGSESL